MIGIASVDLGGIPIAINVTKGSAVTPAAKIAESSSTFDAFDQYGFPRRTVESLDTGDGPGFLTSRTVEYEHISNLTSDRWHLGLEKRMEARLYYQGDQNLQVTYREFDPTTGFMDLEETRSGLNRDDPLRLTTTFIPDAYGHIETKEVADANGNLRITKTFFSDLYGGQRNFPTEIQQVVNGELLVQRLRPHIVWGSPVWESDINGTVTTHAYDTYGRRVSTTYPDGTTETEHIVPSADPDIPYHTTTTGRQGQRQETYTDRLGRTVAERHKNFVGRWARTSRAFDQFGNEVVVTNSLDADPGRSLGAVPTSIWTREYDALGALTAEIDPQGNRTEYIHRLWTRNGVAAGIEVEQRRPNHAWRSANGTNHSFSRKIRYNWAGLAHEVVEGPFDDGSGGIQYNRITYQYSPLRNLKSITLNGSHTVSVDTDDYGLRTEVNDPNAGSEVYGHNAFGEATRVMRDDGSVSIFYRDDLGRTTRRRDIDGHGADEDTFFTYDDRTLHGRTLLASMRSADGHETEYVYDRLGRPERIIRRHADGRSFTHHYSYRQDGLLDVHVYPHTEDGSWFATKYAYRYGVVEGVYDATSRRPIWRRIDVDHEGRTTREAFGNGIVTTRAYDGRGSLITLQSQHPSIGTHQNQGYRYDARGNLEARIDYVARNHERFEYDLFDRLVQAEIVGHTNPPSSPWTPPSVDQPTMDLLLTHLEKAAFQHPGSGSLPPVETTFPSHSGPTLTLPVTGLGAATHRAVVSVGTPISGDGELPGLQSPLPPSSGGIQTFKYDAEGNMTFRTGVGHFQYDAEVARNGAQTRLPHAVSGFSASPTGSAPSTIRYDERGRIVQDDQVAFAWNPQGRLRYVQSPAWDHQLSYDAQGAKVRHEHQGLTTYFAGDFRQRHGNSHSISPEQSSTASADSVTSHFSVSVDGMVVAEVMHMDQLPQPHTSAEAQAHARGEIPTAGLTSASRAISRDLNSIPPGIKASVQFHHYGRLGSLEVLTNAEGKVIERRSYDAFGEVRRSDPVEFNIGYAGKSHLNGLADWVEMGGRLYSAKYGRFASPDPLIADPHYSQSINRYSYAYNNPLKFVDPDGRYPRQVGKTTSVTRSDGRVEFSTPYQVKNGGTFLLIEGRFPNGDYYVGLRVDSEPINTDILISEINAWVGGTWYLSNTGTIEMHSDADMLGRVTSMTKDRAWAWVDAWLFTAEVGLSVGAGAVAIARNGIRWGIARWMAEEVSTRTLGVIINESLDAAGIKNPLLRFAASLAVGRAAGTVRKVGSMLSLRRGCFVAGTLVATGTTATAIEDVRVGDRVTTTSQKNETGVDETWRRVRLQMTDEGDEDFAATQPRARTADLRSDAGEAGRVDNTFATQVVHNAGRSVVHVELLRPPSWLAAHGGVGRADAIYLDIDELGVRGWANVVNIEPAPAPAEGAGRVVLSTFRRWSNDVYEVSFVDERRPLRGTGAHPLYSLTQNEWVEVRDLQVGERLQTAEGAVTVEALEKVRGVHRVYNLEVERDHEYLAGEAKVRAHNSCLPRFLRNKMKRIRNATAAGGNRGITGSVSADEARRLGEAFVGEGHRAMSNGKGLVSADGLRTFRFPSAKRGINPDTMEPWSKTGIQVNFETKLRPGTPSTSNVHLDVIRSGN